MSSLSPSPSSTLKPSSPVAAIPFTPASTPWTERLYLGLSGLTWVKAGVLALLMAGLFRFNLQRLYLKTNPGTGEANWQHSFFIPLIGFAYLYINRDQLLRAPIVPLFLGRFSPMRVALGVLTSLIGVTILLLPRFGAIVTPWGMSAAAWAGTLLVAAGISIPLAATCYDRRRIFSGLAVIAMGVAAWLVGPIVLHSNEVLAVAAKFGGQFLIVLGVLAIVLDWGLATLVWGLMLYVAATIYLKNDFLSDFGMVATLFGIVLTLCGWEVMKLAAFPIVFLVCAIPWPALVYSRVAIPLQELAATVGTIALKLTGFTADQVGTKFIITDKAGVQHPLNVAEACAGMKSLMTFIALGATVGWVLSNRPLWQRLVLIVSAVPIAILCNVMRVAGIGILYNFNSAVAEGFVHQFVGVILLIPGFFMLMGVGWVLDNVFVEQSDDAPAGATPAKRRAGKPATRPQPTANLDGPRRPTLGTPATAAASNTGGDKR